MATGAEAECIRLPKDGEHDPVFGLSRPYLNTLILPSRRNGFRVVVKSYVLLRPGNTKKGVRLIDLQSLRDYVRSHVRISHAGEPVPVATTLQIKEELKVAA